MGGLLLAAVGAAIVVVPKLTGGQAQAQGKAPASSGGPSTAQALGMAGINAGAKLLGDALSSWGQGSGQGSRDWGYDAGYDDEWGGF